MTCKVQTIQNYFFFVDSAKGISETWVARQRLEDLYKKLLLMDLEYALDKKVEQEL
jgi:protein SMG7